jgi:hypothetical protein
MWTAQNRRRYDRSQLRYPSDLTDDEWAHVAPLIPPAKAGGNKRSVDVREVMNGIMYFWPCKSISPPPLGNLRAAKLPKSLTISYPSQ